MILFLPPARSITLLSVVEAKNMIPTHATCTDQHQEKKNMQKINKTPRMETNMPRVENAK